MNTWMDIFALLFLTKSMRKRRKWAIIHQVCSILSLWRLPSLVQGQIFDVSGLASFFDRPSGSQTPASTSSIRFNDDPLRFPIFGTSNPPSVNAVPVSRDIPVCHQQTCDQDYQLRNVRYSSALSLVNTREFEEESYVSAEGIVRRRRRSVDPSPIGIQIHITRLTNATDLTTPFPRAGSSLGWHPMVQERQDLNRNYIVRPGLGQAPPEQPQPGQPGGGALPIARSPQSALALALVPPAHVPVSVMPPFTELGNFPAVCAIFSESDEDSIRHFQRQGQALKRRLIKRDIGSWYRRYAKNLRRFFIRRPQKKKPSGRGHAKPRPIHQGLGPMFRHIPEGPTHEKIHVPRVFGIRCRARLIDRPCVLGQTCDRNGSTLRSIRPNQSESRTHPQSHDKLTHPALKYRKRSTFINRQTGERFFTAAPPDCRTELRDECLN